MGHRDYGRGHGKHPRDHRHHHAHVDSRTRGTFAGAHGTVTAVRDVTRGEGSSTERVIERQYPLAFPNTLRDRVQSLSIKENRVLATGETGSGRIRSRVLVISFRSPQNGITGLAVSLADERKLRRTGYTHVTIERIPEAARDAVAPRPDGYDERAFRITWWKPKGGHPQRDGKHGEVVHECVDELQVLQWISENALLPLYEVPHLLSCGLLPKRDEDRALEDALERQLENAFGRTPRFHPKEHFHAHRLLQRFFTLCEGDQVLALELLAASARGASMTFETLWDRVEAYLATNGGEGYALVQRGPETFAIQVDVPGGSVACTRVEADEHGALDLAPYEQFPTRPDHFRRATWEEFVRVLQAVSPPAARAFC